jgi:RNA polymerase sigma-70 factor (ECF subfamily)
MASRTAAQTRPVSRDGAAKAFAAARSAADDKSGELVDHWGTLMVAAQRGDNAAYDLLLRELDTWLHRYFRRRLSPAAADDAVQEVLLAVHSRRHSYEPRGPFGHWLTAIARYKWMDRLRQKYRHGDTLSSDIDIPVEDHRHATCSAVVVDRLIARLKPAQAEVIRMVKLDGATVEEASRATGQSPSLVKVNVHRGIRKIVEYLDADN